jgi:integrase
VRQPPAGRGLASREEPTPPHRQPRALLGNHGVADSVDSSGRLRCILALARYTGRRESALCAIRANDLLLTAERIRAALAEAGMNERLADHMPHGAIRWRAETDKQGFLFISPISSPAREALEMYLRQSPRMGDVPLFQAPGATRPGAANPPGDRHEMASIP